MPRVGATYTRPSNSFTEPVTGTPISSSDADAYFDDLDTALTESATYESPTFTGTVDVSQALKVSGVISPAQITANQNNYNPTGLSTAAVLRLSSDAARDITGLAGGAAGRQIQIQNVGGFAITLKDSSGSSDAANQFALSADLVLAADSVALLFYDGTSTKWRSLNDTAAAGGSSIDQGKHTAPFSANGMIPRVTNGPSNGVLEMSTNKNMVVTLDFDTTTQEFAQFLWIPPKSWDEGTVTFQPLWSHPSTTTNFGVVWALQGVAISDDDTLDVAFGTEQTSTDTGGTTNDLYIGPESSAITIGGTPAELDAVLFQIKRVPADGADTLAVDARLHGIRLYFTINAATDA